MALAFVLTIALAVPPAFAQSPGDADGPVAWISVLVQSDQSTRLVVNGRASGPAIASALERMTGRAPQVTDHENGWSRWTCPLPPPSRDGLLLRQELRLDPLLEALHTAGQSNVLVRVQSPAAGTIRLGGATVLARADGVLNTTLSTRPAGPLLMESGWQNADVARVVGTMALALLSPILAGLLVWRRSLQRDRRPEAWFLRAIAFQSIVIFGWAAWIAAVEGARVADLTSFAFRGQTRFAPLWMMGFLPAALALVAMLRANTRRLRGFSPRPRGMGQLFGSARTMVSLTLLVVAIAALGASDFRLTVFALLGAVGAVTFLPGAHGPLGTKPQALSTGALRDRLFDLANRAGVKLRELYVAPMRRERMANAFAINGGVVMLTDELLDHLSKREVDAVLAHEVSHLEHGHPAKMVLAALAAWALAVVVTMPLGIGYAFPIGLAASRLVYLHVVRRFEFAADAGAAALTSDPEATISGLGRLAKLNDVPLSWGRRIGWLITHPTTEARARTIGRRARLAPARVEELLRNGLGAAEHYGGAERPGEMETRVFSTAWKAAVTGRLSITFLTSAVAMPALALGLAKAFGVEPPHVAAIVGGAVLALGGLLLTQDLLAARGVSGLEDAIRHRVGAGRTGSFVALSPGERSRIYEGFLDWDLGVLEVASDRLIYRGEQTSLELPRPAIRSIEVGARAPGWIAPWRVVLRWSGPSGDEALTLRPAGCRRVSRIAGGSREMAAKLREWFGTRGAAVSGPPGIGSVTARTPAEAAAPRDLLVLVVLLGILSAGAGFLAGFDFERGSDLFVAAFIGVMAMRWPAMTWREPKAAKADGPDAQRRAA